MRLLLPLVLSAQTCFLQATAADDSAKESEVKLLRQKIEQLERRLQALEGASTPQTGVVSPSPAHAMPSSTAKPAPTVMLDANGLTVRSQDSNFVFRIHGYIQADGRFYLSDTSHDTFLLRRVRPIFEGTVYDRFDYRVMLDFGQGNVSGSNPGNQTVVQDAYFNTRLLPEFQIRVGKFIPPVGLERLQSSANLIFVERAYPTQLVPNRDTGVMLHGDLLEKSLYYGAGVFNGTADGGSSDFEVADGDKDFAGRVFAQPFTTTEIKPLKGLGFGLAGTWGKQDGALRPFVSPGQERIFNYYANSGTNVTANGVHWRLAPQAYYYAGPFGLLSEYVVSDQEIARNAGGSRTSGQVQQSAWQVVGSYVLTGEDNSYKGVTPDRPVSFGEGERGWGALELAARISQLIIDPATFPDFSNPAISARRATSWGVGVNWYLNKNVKVSADYERTEMDGGKETLVNEKGEQVIFSRVQVSF